MLAKAGPLRHLERIACHLAQRTHDFPRAVRFCQKAAARGQIFGAQVRPSRCGNDFNGRPPASHGRGQLKTVHGTRHMDLKTTVMSGRRSRISMASSASFASMTSKPPDLIISIASMRMRNSSSTIRTTARWFVSEYAKSNVSHCTQALWMSLVPHRSAQRQMRRLLSALLALTLSVYEERPEVIDRGPNRRFDPLGNE